MAYLRAAVGVFAIGVSAVLIKGWRDSYEEKLRSVQERLRNENEAAIRKQKEYMEEFKQKVECLRTSNYVRPRNAEIRIQQLIDVLENNLDRTVDSTEVLCRAIVMKLPTQMQEKAMQYLETLFEWVRAFQMFLKGILNGMRAASTLLDWLRLVWQRLEEIAARIVNSAQDAIRNIRSNTKLQSGHFCNAPIW
ncbi:hypothetical protein BDZ91DRAFT_508797 [Kalaharituber pfeilii]|nr:hypothetical protein BDZ91DRAFT_508797 [Kalaharituber pfeilii]